MPSQNKRVFSPPFLISPLPFRICLSQILNLPLHMRIIRREDPNGNTMSHKSTFFVESSVIWDGIYVFFFCNSKGFSSQTSSFLPCIEMHRSNILFSPRFMLFSILFPHPFGEKGREVGKIRKQQRKTHPSKVRGRLNICVWGYLKFCC